MSGGRTTAGMMTAEIGTAMHEARRRRATAETSILRYTEGARGAALSALDAAWTQAEEEWSRYLASDPGVAESNVLAAFARVAPDPVPFGWGG